MSSEITTGDVCLELFLTWLVEQHDRRFQVESSSSCQDPPGFSALCTDGTHRLAVEVSHLLGVSKGKAWNAGREALEDDIAADLNGAYAIWLPPGAELPGVGDERSIFLRRLREIASSLETGQRAQFHLPAKLRLYKSSDVGGLMTVAGPLDTYWARMSERVRGGYELDSRELHRLSESDEERQELVDKVVDKANSLTELRQQVEIDANDIWTVQRLTKGEGVIVVGLPPEETVDTSIAIRRNFRRNLTEAKTAIATQECDLRALVSLGLYSHIGEEGATTALRGYDPSVYAGLDFVCLAADGRIRAQVESPAMPWLS